MQQIIMTAFLYSASRGEDIPGTNWRAKRMRFLKLHPHLLTLLPHPGLSQRPAASLVSANYAALTCLGTF